MPVFSHTCYVDGPVSIGAVVGGMVAVIIIQIIIIVSLIVGILLAYLGKRIIFFFLFYQHNVNLSIIQVVNVQALVRVQLLMEETHQLKHQLKQ